MFWREKHLIAAFSIAICSGCGSLPVANGAVVAPDESPASPPDKEKEVFRLAVTKLGDSLSLVHVDPRPVVIENTIRYPDAASYHDHVSEVTAARLEVLAELGIDTTTSFPVRAGCSGPLVPPGFKRTSECPSEDRSELAFDLIKRVGGADEYRVRVIHIFYTPRNRSAIISDLYWIKVGKEYAHSRTQVLVFID